MYAVGRGSSGPLMRITTRDGREWRVFRSIQTGELFCDTEAYAIAGCCAPDPRARKLGLSAPSQDAYTDIHRSIAWRLKDGFALLGIGR